MAFSDRAGSTWEELEVRQLAAHEQGGAGQGHCREAFPSPRRSPSPATIDGSVARQLASVRAAPRQACKTRALHPVSFVRGPGRKRFRKSASAGCGSCGELSLAKVSGEDFSRAFPEPGREMGSQPALRQGVLARYRRPGWGLRSTTLLEGQAAEPRSGSWRSKRARILVARRARRDARCQPWAEAVDATRLAGSALMCACARRRRCGRSEARKKPNAIPRPRRERVITGPSRRGIVSTVCVRLERGRPFSVGPWRFNRTPRSASISRLADRGLARGPEAQMRLEHYRAARVLLEV